MEGGSFSSGYSQVEGGADPSLLAYLERVAAVPAVDAAKRAASDALALRPGSRVLEAGCGTGVDLPLLADAVGPEGQVVGLDPYQPALDAAAARVQGRPNVRLVHARAEELPFDAAAFDACRVDRALQHMPHPERVLAELRRVLVPGGRLVILEAGSRFEAAGADAAITDHLSGRLTTQRPQEWIPLWLPVLLKRAGFTGVEMAVEETTSDRYADADAMLRLEPALDEAVAAGAIKADAAEDWRAAVRAAESAGTLRLVLRFIRFVARSA